jgi:hypothetical protein
VRQSTNAVKTQAGGVQALNSFVATIAVAFLARGADAGWHSSILRANVFSVRTDGCRPGVEHSLYVISRGIHDASALNEGKNLEL